MQRSLIQHEAQFGTDLFHLHLFKHMDRAGSVPQFNMRNLQVVKAHKSTDSFRLQQSEQMKRARFLLFDFFTQMTYLLEILGRPKCSYCMRYNAP